MIYHSSSKYDLKQLIWEREWGEKQAALWKNAWSEDSAVCCHDCTCCSICSARWRYSRTAVAGEFSLAWEHEAQRHHTAPASCCATLTTLRFTPPDDERAALLVTLNFYGALISLAKKQRAKEWPVQSGLPYLRCNFWPDVWNKLNFLSLTLSVFFVGDLSWQFWSSMATFCLCKYKWKA